MSKTSTMRIITNGPKRTLAEALQDKGILDEEVVIEGDDEKGNFPASTLIERPVRPTHPGAILLRLYLPRTGLTQTELAQRLGVSRHALTQLLREQRPMTADMAHRLARVLGTSAGLWINLQRDRDAWDALHIDTSAYEVIEPLPRRVKAA